MGRTVIERSVQNFISFSYQLSCTLVKVADAIWRMRFFNKRKIQAHTWRNSLLIDVPFVYSFLDNVDLSKIFILGEIGRKVVEWQLLKSVYAIDTYLSLTFIHFIMSYICAKYKA